MRPWEYSYNLYFYHSLFAELQILENPFICGSGVDLEALSCGLGWIYYLLVIFIIQFSFQSVYVYVRIKLLFNYLLFI